MTYDVFVLTYSAAVKDNCPHNDDVCSCCVKGIHISHPRIVPKCIRWFLPCYKIWMLIYVWTVTLRDHKACVILQYIHQTSVIQFWVQYTHGVHLLWLCSAFCILRSGVNSKRDLKAEHAVNELTVVNIEWIIFYRSRFWNVTLKVHWISIHTQTVTEWMGLHFQSGLLEIEGREKQILLWNTLKMLFRHHYLKQNQTRWINNACMLPVLLFCNVRMGDIWSCNACVTYWIKSFIFYHRLWIIYSNTTVTSSGCFWLVHT